MKKAPPQKTLTLITGLPYSGKTTKARELVAEDPFIAIRLSLKDLKAMHSTHIAGDSFASASIKHLTSYYLGSGYNVIIDSDDLDPAHVERWKLTAKINDAKFKHVPIKKSMEKCIEAAQKGGEKARVSDIVNTALRFGKYPKTLKPFHVVDVSGFEGFTKNEFKAFVDNMETGARAGKDIILISPLFEDKRKATEEWLREKGIFGTGLPINTLIMSEKGGPKRNHQERIAWIISTYNLKQDADNK